ncbi:MAG: hypothetical protein ACYCYM_07140 [Saccharofermentanales bacterium]
MNFAMAEDLVSNLKGLDKVFYLASGYIYIIIAAVALVLVFNILCIAGIFRLGKKTDEMVKKLAAVPSSAQRDTFSGSSTADLQVMRDSELVAVISAAIASMEGTSGNTAPYPGFKVKSIRKI